MNCSLDADSGGLTCADLQCPFSEEVTRINLTLLVRNQYRLEEHQKAFFIHDISKSWPEPSVIHTELKLIGFIRFYFLPKSLSVLRIMTCKSVRTYLRGECTKTI